ncbi:hypothetical protein BKA61DRAFT_741936 [Leptodontidium sp. MPI-SDFR-AT-0119]|nr:hypothetical protein BKA61DRAFT_741936 [Leptodontidium sp. MPI-SDFR-AT-0119]
MAVPLDLALLVRLDNVCLVILSVLYLCLASPLQVERPGISNHFNELQFLKRATSQDPSCPAGWLCEQQSCPGDVVCSSGEICVEFEGTPACAPAGASWCALNPNTFQAVECINGICCHGNCYNADAVCCDNSAVQCTIGNLCNACGPGQTCTTGATTCVGGDGEHPTTSKSSTQTTPTITIPTTNKSPTTTKPPSTTSISITPPPTTTTSKPPSVPTEVPQVGDFKDIGCYQDSPDSRILVADSTEDQSSTGMTVEKCVAFAIDNSWQYAGVEFGGQCFVGNSLHGAATAPQSDCSQACAGNPSETCGNGNRMQIYKDSTWFSPTTQQLIDELTKYNATLSSARSAVQKFHDDLQKYQNDGGPSKRKKRDPIGGVLTATLRLDLENMHGDFTMLKAIQASNIPEEEIIRRIFKIAMYLDLPKPVQGIPVTDEIFQELDTNVVGATSSTLDKVTQVAETADAAIGPALEQSIIPAIDVVTDIAVTATAITSVGIWTGIAVGTGILGAIAALLGELATGPGAPTPTKTNSPTTTSKSTSSSSTCTMTATPTPIIIVANQGTTTQQFNALVDSLPSNAKPQKFTTNTEGHLWLIATLNQCDSEALWDNPNVQAMAIDNYIVGDDYLDPLTALPTNYQRRSTKRSESQRDDEATFLNSTIHEIDSRQLSGSSHIVAQTNAPDNLNWISGLSRQKGLSGQLNDFEDFMYDDGANSPSQPQTWDYANRIGAHFSAFVGYLGSGQSGLTPDSTHGTNMASCAAGTFAGPAKNAMLGLVRLQTNNPKYAVVSSTLLAFDRIIDHSLTVSSRGRSVVGMSFAAPVQLLWWPAPERNPPNGGLADGTDVIGIKLQDLFRVGIAAAASAGNYARSDPPVNDLSYHTPRRNGGASSPLVVVGNNDLNNARWSTSQFLDRSLKGILSIYAVGVDCVCGEYIAANANTATSQNSFRLLTNPSPDGGKDEQGTSQATAQTVGVMANMMSDPAIQAQLVAGGLANFAMAVKTRLLLAAVGNKGTFDDSTPRLSSNISIPCPGPAFAGRPIPPAPNQALFRQVGLVPTYQEVASGLTVTFPNPPNCYNMD